MFLPRLIVFFRIFSIKVSKIRFYLLHSGVLRIKVFPFDSVFILFFKEKPSLIRKYKDIIIFHADYGDPISTEYGHIAMIASAYSSGKQIRYKTVSANNHGKLKLKVKPETQNGTKVRLKGKGYDKGDGTFGDMIITYDVKLPKHLSERQRELLKQMREG